MNTSTDILLTQPKHKQDKNVPYSGREIPLGITYLASYLENNNISAEILDLNICDQPFLELEKEIKKLRPKFVGISSFTVDISEANRIARFCKEINNDIVTVIGGIHASALPERTLKEFKYFDYLIHGQGEKPLTNLIQKIKEKKNVSDTEGLAYRKNGNISINPRSKYIPLSELPFPARHKMELQKYAPHPQKYVTLPNTGILTSIGCPFSCSYCSIHVVHSEYNIRPAESVVKEIKECILRFGISDFRFLDDCLTLNKTHITELCNLFIREKLKIHWNCQSRVDKVDLELLKLMKEAGCHQITYGIETGTEKGLSLINKQTTLDKAVLAVAFTKKAGLESGGSFILGIPGETVEDVKKTIDFSIKLSPDIATFYVLKPYPGTRIFEDIMKRTKIGDIDWDSYLLQGPPPFDLGIPREEMPALVKYAYHRFYFRTNYFWQRFKKFFKSPKREIFIAVKGFFMVLSYFKKR